MSLRRKFLVTAATTPLGRALSRRLAGYGEVYAIREPADPPPDADQNVVCEADLTRHAEARKVIAGVVADAAVDTIVHLETTVGAHERCASPNAIRTKLLLDGARDAACVRTFVLQSAALLYRLHHDDPMLITEGHSLDLSPNIPRSRRDLLEADIAACQRMVNTELGISVLRLSPVIAAGAADGLAGYLRLDPCYRPLGFDAMVNVVSLDDAADALARAAHRAPRGIFNVAGADTLPFSELAARSGARCWPVPGATIEPLCALRRMPEHCYRGFTGLLHHGLVVDGRAAARALGFTATRPL